MVTASGIQKKIFLGFLILSLVTAVSAAEASITPVNGDTTWANQVSSDKELSYACTGSDLKNVTVVSKGEKLGLQASTGDVSSSQIDSVLSFENDDNLGSQEFAIYCENESISSDTISSDTAVLNLKKFQAGFGNDARGFFDGKLEEGEFQAPLSISELSVDDGQTTDDKTSDVSFSFPDEEITVENGDWDLDSMKIYPVIRQGFNPTQDEIKVKATYSGEEETVSVTKTVDIEVYPYKTDIISGSTGRKISYDDLGEFSYTLNLETGKGITDDVYQEHFRLTVTQVSGEDAGNVVYEDEQWFESSEPEGSGEYKLKLSNIPDLTLGEKYEFRTEIVKEINGNTRTTPVDTIRVVNNLQFSGVVRDSSGGPVRTEMVLKRQSSENIPVNTGSDGTYSTTIQDRDFDTVNLEFFDRGRNAPDTTFSLTDITLGENPNLGFSSEAIRYQYWNSPISNVKGLQEVNMMAGKFSHDVKGSAEAFMKFDPQSVNPENLRVYECSSWNFQGRKCMSSWNAMDSNDVSINYATWQVHLQDLDLHEIPEDVTGGDNKTILMNAYIVGTSSKLGLRGDSPLTVNSQRLAANKEVKVSGTVVNGNGETVADANVDVSLVKDGETFRSFQVTSGPNGGFEASGKAPSEEGRYKINVEVSKAKYQAFETSSSKTLEVFYEKGIKMSSRGNPSLKLGETSALSFSVSNTGQKKVEDIQVAVSGLETQYFTKSEVPRELGAGESKILEISIDLPSDYCPAPCANPPIIEVEASGISVGETLNASSTIYTSISRDQTPQQMQDEEQEEDTQTSDQNSAPENDTNSTGSFSISDSVNNMTGNFLKRQSSVNMALGLIMIFTMILAVAIKRKKDDGGRGDRMRGGNSRGGSRPVSKGSTRVSKPQVSPQEEDQVDEGTVPDGQVDEATAVEEQVDETEDAVDEENNDVEETEEEEGSDEGLERFYDEEKEAYVCDETGEEFDTKEGLKMHRKINNIDS